MIDYMKKVTLTSTTKAGLILVNGLFIDVVFPSLILDAFDYSILHFCSALMHFVLAFLALALIDGVTAGQSPLSTSPQEAVSQAVRFQTSPVPPTRSLIPWPYLVPCSSIPFSRTSLLPG